MSGDTIDSNYSITTSATNAISATLATDDDPSDIKNEQLKQWMEFINSLYSNYMDPYTKTIQSYTAFLDEIAKLESFISTKINGSGDDKDPVVIDCKAITEYIDNLITSFSPPSPKAVLFAGNSQEEAKQWARELGMDYSFVEETPAGSGNWILRIDTSPLTEIKGVFKPDNGDPQDKTKFGLPKYDQVVTGKNAQVTNVQNRMKTLAEKYSRAVSTTNNINLIFSNTCKSIFEMLSQFTR